jgi:predicted nuclease of predicted toxin-antitoxin system
MKFLVDHQLPVALSKFLEDRGFEARHVMNLNLDQASDQSIVQYARQNEFVIITKDEDFSILAALGLCAPPIIWVRLGNCRKSTLLIAFSSALDSLLHKLAAGDKLIELLPE